MAHSSTSVVSLATHNEPSTGVRGARTTPVSTAHSRAPYMPDDTEPEKLYLSKLPHTLV